VSARSIVAAAVALAALVLPLGPRAASAQQLGLLVGGDPMYAPSVLPGEVIPVEISLACETACGEAAEWWIWVENMNDPTDARYFDGAAGKWRSGSAPSYDRPLADTAPLTLPGRLTLPEGQWFVRFAVDRNRGGVRHEGAAGYTEYQADTYSGFISQYVQPGFFDDFSDGDAKGWTTDGSGAWGLAGQAYRAAANQRMRVFWSRHAGQYDDFAFSADVRLRAGDALSRRRGFGLMFRSAGGYNNCYAFHINANGYYLIFKRVNGRTVLLTRDWTPHPAISKGVGAWNTLQVQAYGDYLSFSINGTQVDQFNDVSFARGYAGVKAFGDSASGDRFQFDNVRLFAGGN
jgi:hypothetical protein